jgi:exopolysaccharide biosynthesis polyprenyl glycosylphosphotransferase
MSTKPTPTSIPKLAGERFVEQKSGPREELFAQGPFLKMLHLEQLRAERSGRRFVLMLIESENLLTSGNRAEIVDLLARRLRHATRATDITGWYKDGTTIGTIFTEIGDTDGKSVAKALLTKVTSVLADSLSIEQINQIHISFHLFPEDWEGDETGGSSPSVMLRSSALDGGPKKASLVVKRAMDVVGSLLALVLLFPALVAIAIAIKLTSKGPVLFRQERVGQHGRKFVFLKFRSMQCKNDSSIHEAFTRELIAGKNGLSGDSGSTQAVFKIQNDPRVTSIGKFLRRTSLDELPQFINVLNGEMSLVGPRPPIPYEVKCYNIWHRRRLFMVKPGITGLWQVSGRSKIGFDDMVRLDLKYARTWSLWLDLKILAQTPHAVISGAGAY